MIDDSMSENFQAIENFLSQQGVVYEHKSGSHAKESVIANLNNMKFSTSEEASIKTCFGIS